MKLFLFIKVSSCKPYPQKFQTRTNLRAENPKMKAVFKSLGSQIHICCDYPLNKSKMGQNAYILNKLYMVETECMCMRISTVTSPNLERSGGILCSYVV